MSTILNWILQLRKQTVIRSNLKKNVSVQFPFSFEQFSNKNYSCRPFFATPGQVAAHCRFIIHYWLSEMVPSLKRNTKSNYASFIIHLQKMKTSSETNNFHVNKETAVPSSMLFKSGCECARFHKTYENHLVAKFTISIEAIFQKIDTRKCRKSLL